MMRFPILLIALILLTSVEGRSQTGENIKAYAEKALEGKNCVRKGNTISLYGIRTNGPDTRNGDWACAKVVTIVLQKAGVVDQIYLGVGEVEKALNPWKKITSKKDLQPGDVVFWVSRFKGRKDEKCTGGGNCHVGIVTEKGYFHNSPITNAPTFGGPSLWAFKFKYAARPPD